MLRAATRLRWGACWPGLCLAAQLAAQEPSVTVGVLAPGAGGSLLTEVLAAPHTVIRTPGQKVRLPKDSTFASSVVIIGSDAAIASTVHGDVLVVGGDLFLHPGAAVDGRAISIGGNVYGSALATIGGRSVSLPDVRYDASQTAGGIALSYYHDPASDRPLVELTLPPLYGLRAPAYSRVDGVSLPWGPRVTLFRGAATLDPVVTWRTDIGAFDPSAVLTAPLSSRYRLRLAGAQATLSNDEWMKPAFLDSVATLFAGRDYRNYFRGVRYQGMVTRDWPGDIHSLSLSLGARTERDWSVSAGGPWSLFGGDDRQGILRLNPGVRSGRLSSAIAGAIGSWTGTYVRLSGSLDVEVPWAAPADARFVQTTLDVSATVPTTGLQSLDVRTHAVLTAGDTAPPQRFAYLGGAYTLPPFDILALGGDELVWFRARYDVPLTGVKLKLLGSPTVSAQYAGGGAAVKRLGRIEHSLGVRLAISLLFVSFDVDPRTGHGALSVGAALSSLGLPGGGGMLGAPAGAGVSAPP